MANQRHDGGPIIALTLGDAAGIGPEVAIKALAAGDVGGRVVLLGALHSAEAAIALTAAPVAARRILDIAEASFEPGHLDVLDPGFLPADAMTTGRPSAACGRAALAWLDLADQLGREGTVDAVIMGPVNTESFKLAGGRLRATPFPAGSTFLFLVSGPLRIVHLTDHVPLRAVSDAITTDDVAALLRLTDQSLKRWGLAAPRIGVAGFNPHADGDEETVEIAPAIAEAVADGIHAIGPVPPDTVFRQAIDGRFDCVLAHYHDQGHIALKTWGFSGNCALMLGAPYLFVTVAHGTAFDIAGQGIADPAMMRSALATAASLAAGRGFSA